MKSVMVAFEGLDELRKALRDLPDELEAQARVIVEDAANKTAGELLAAYPHYGALHNGVHVVDKSSKLQARFVVESRSHEASWWEFGTQNRHTQKGWNRGAAPAHPGQGLVPLAGRNRRAMRGDLVALVRANGFDVVDDGG